MSNTLLYDFSFFLWPINTMSCTLVLCCWLVLFKYEFPWFDELKINKIFCIDNVVSFSFSTFLQENFWLGADLTVIHHLLLCCVDDKAYTYNKAEYVFCDYAKTQRADTHLCFHHALSIKAEPICPRPLPCLFEIYKLRLIQLVVFVKITELALDNLQVRNRFDLIRDVTTIAHD